MMKLILLVAGFVFLACAETRPSTITVTSDQNPVAGEVTAYKGILPMVQMVLGTTSPAQRNNYMEPNAPVVGASQQENRLPSAGRSSHLHASHCAGHDA